ncbi:Peptidase family C78 [Teratosphaeria destructans]|uniref:Peptidase family C78 n=1 Tax=Teratosphaeria destructans TaxID=418781 RepID=A0A9W7SRR1_9PEZI|nr:Peptidase family C78 [Teratosphaeria destructans]
MADIACPFCGVTSIEPFVIELHIQDVHSEGDAMNERDAVLARTLASSPADEDATPPPSHEWVKCTRPSCGDYVHVREMDEHVELHDALIASDNGSASGDNVEEKSSLHYQMATRASLAAHDGGRGERAKGQSRHKGPSQRTLTLLDYFSGHSVHGNSRPKPIDYQQHRRAGQLGRGELGPHAYEKAMPDQVRRHLINDAKAHRVNRIGSNGRMATQTVVDNNTEGVVRIIAELCAKHETTVVTYLCSAIVKHVNKLKCDGNFCGYWNIQMLLTYFPSTPAKLRTLGLPNVLQIQDDIEDAWRSGICPHGRIETGGIRNTRKWIGTSEATAYFTHIGIPVTPLCFKDETDQLAVTSLLDYVEAYFLGGAKEDQVSGTSHVTKLAPIYLQRRGHSMTVVGIERKDDGSRNLIVFDPSFETSQSVKNLIDGRKTTAKVENLLKPYRRSDASLARWNEFEVLVVQAKHA